LFAGKFERGKDPIGFMKAIASLRDSKVVAVMVGGGALQNEVQGFARLKPDMFRILPFQNQSRMPIVYRLGDVFVMPSHGETWGLAVNEALACGRPALVSERVGCAVDVIDGSCGQIFPENGLADVLRCWSSDKTRLISMRAAASARGRRFDIHRTEAALVEAIEALSEEQSTTP
jgi:glycosyltransferase involved in cell wall biosynthesis